MLRISISYSSPCQLDYLRWNFIVYLIKIFIQQPLDFRYFGHHQWLIWMTPYLEIHWSLTQIGSRIKHRFHRIASLDLAAVREFVQAMSLQGLRLLLPSITWSPNSHGGYFWMTILSGIQCQHLPKECLSKFVPEKLPWYCRMCSNKNHDEWHILSARRS